MPYHFEIALEQVVVGYVEADDGGVESDVRFGDVFAEEIGMVTFLAEVVFYALEGVEEGVDVLFVDFLRAGEAGLVNAWNNC